MEMQDTCNNMNKPQKYYAKWKKLVSNKVHIYDFIIGNSCDGWNLEIKAD